MSKCLQTVLGFSPGKTRKASKLPNRRTAKRVVPFEIK
jgi:hypothetical protein